MQSWGRPLTMQRSRNQVFPKQAGCSQSAVSIVTENEVWKKKMLQQHIEQNSEELEGASQALRNARHGLQMLDSSLLHNQKLLTRGEKEPDRMKARFIWKWMFPQLGGRVESHKLIGVQLQVSTISGGLAAMSLTVLSEVHTNAARKF